MKKKSKNKDMENILIIFITAIIILGAILLTLSRGENEITGEATVEIIKDCGEGTIFYKFTDICWQKSTMPGTANWENASLYCENLTLGGKSNWRLPTLEELRRIVKYIPGEVSINTDFFEDTKETYYWTSTEYQSKENLHAFIHFKKGYEKFAPDYIENFSVRCVRTNY